MHGHRIHALRQQFVVLVFHQGDERGDDDREAVQHHGAELVDQRLAAARRHHDEHVAAFRKGFYGLPLAAAEVFMAEPVAEMRDRLGFCNSFGHRGY